MHSHARLVAGVKRDCTPKTSVRSVVFLCIFLLGSSQIIARSEEQFGRTYHAYRSGSYYYPNDPTEIERLDNQYEIIKMVMDGRKYLAPFSRETPPRRVLDIGTGTGTWAIEMGDEFPNAEIVRTDLSPIQPEYVPQREEWDFRNTFDYIHTRVTLGCWSDMKTQIIQRTYDNLEPGGWLECQEPDIIPACDDNTMTPDYGWLNWANKMTATSEKIDRQLQIGNWLKGWFEEVGFVDVHEVYLGILWQRNMMSGLSGLSLGLFGRVLNKTVEEIEVSLVDVRNSFFNRRGSSSSWDENQRPTRS
ncbi:S-adenosyl-L-methionine-dependent methyltransferase [Apodospora peruviana]|uniref:S-adenosyl-L-methionine-dependent methyltransferase n=1 Tax=Apodospora peruviana TaxID=516989 RepID=A0AAE0IIR6_9PEZI|nr:S-adenosyl-L-methionine-dependent methyltransferase [Apodospora peruviana]